MKHNKKKNKNTKKVSTNKTKNPSASNDNTKYDSAELLLDIIQNEYRYENDRNKGFQNRAGIFISLTGVILTFLFSNINIHNLLNKPTEKLSDSILPALCIIFICIILLLLFISLICFIFVLGTQKYSRLSLNGFNSSGASLNKQAVAEKIMEDYADFVKDNSKINNKKAIVFKVGYICLAISIILISIVMLINSII